MDRSTVKCMMDVSQAWYKGKGKLYKGLGKGIGKGKGKGRGGKDFGKGFGNAIAL